jgi:hippurate hydrolase
MSIRDDARALQYDLVRLRRAIHTEPEIGLDLPRTQEKIVAALDGLPLEVRLGTKLSSVTAVLRGARPGPAVLLRADMDALPLTECTGLDYSSTVDGVMHACGHDLHTAMLAGAAHLLSGRRKELAGDVVFMFQPGEEGCDGAAAMIAEGVLDAAGRRPHAAYALHVFTTGLRPGVVTARPGPVMASVDGIDVTIVGTGGHGALPHLARDPIPVACEIVTALSTLATRRADIFDPVVLTTGQFHAGTRRNIIPDTASFGVTFRAFSAATRQRIRDAAVELITSIAAAHGLTAEVTVVEGYPVTVNDAGETDFVATTVAEVLGEHRYAPLPTPFAYAEDFSRILAEVPGTFAILGAGPPGADPDTVPNNHSAHVEFDDALLADGATVYAELAVRRLGARP